jgi:hypothetical protein
MSLASCLVPRSGLDYPTVPFTSLFHRRLDDPSANLLTLPLTPSYGRPRRGDRQFPLATLQATTRGVRARLRRHREGALRGDINPLPELGGSPDVNFDQGLPFFVPGSQDQGRELPQSDAGSGWIDYPLGRGNERGRRQEWRTNAGLDLPKEGWQPTLGRWDQANGADR